MSDKLRPYKYNVHICPIAGIHYMDKFALNTMEYRCTRSMLSGIREQVGGWGKKQNKSSICMINSMIQEHSRLQDPTCRQRFKQFCLNRESYTRACNKTGFSQRAANIITVRPMYEIYI